MKFALASDLHVTFGSLVVENTEGADVLILAGDVYEAIDLPFGSEHHYVRTFFDSVSTQFKHVLWVAGNHEFYGTSIEWGISLIRKWIEHCGWKNVHFLEKESILIDDVWFHGTTLWTSLKNADPLVTQQVVLGIEDFRYIEGLNGLTFYANHIESLRWLKDAVIPDKKNVVITHHQPCDLSIDPMFIMNPVSYGYFTELSEYIFDHQEIKYWCAGHTHRKLYYTIDDTRVVCNPRGYKTYEKIAENFRLEYYDV